MWRLLSIDNYSVRKRAGSAKVISAPPRSASRAASIASARCRGRAALNFRPSRALSSTAGRQSRPSVPVTAACHNVRGDIAAEANEELLRPLCGVGNGAKGGDEGGVGAQASPRPPAHVSARIAGDHGSAGMDHVDGRLAGPGEPGLRTAGQPGWWVRAEQHVTDRTAQREGCTAGTGEDP